MSDDSHDHVLLAELLRRLEERGAEPIDANRLAGLLDGSLAPDEQDALLEQLCHDGVARDEVFALLQQATVSGEVPAAGRVSPRSRWTGGPWVSGAVAASLLIGAWFFWPQDEGPPREGAAMTLEQVLASLEGAVPELKGLSEGRSTRLPDDPLRGDGDPVPVGPRGATADVRPRLRWTATQDQRCTIQLYRADGEVVFEKSAQGSELAYPADAPPLQPGESYLWIVSADPATQERPVPASFRVLSEAERGVLRRASAWLDERAPQLWREAARERVRAHLGLEGDAP